MDTSVNALRRENLTFLINIYGTQTALAAALSHETLSQPILSSIQGKKRLLYGHEARAIEKLLVIPVGWMDRPNWVRSGWTLIKKYRELRDSDRALFNEFGDFVVQRCEKSSN